MDTFSDSSRGTHARYISARADYKIFDPSWLTMVLPV